MGRALRRVPMGWEHPLANHKNEPFMFNGQLMQWKPELLARYQAMHDQTWEEAMAEWKAERKAFFSDDNKAERERIYAKYGKMSFAKWHGAPPDKDAPYYRPEWPADAVMGYCMYETISEGTPVSPIFATLEELGEWLAEDGYSEGAIKHFLKLGSAPSFAVTSDGEVVQNLEILNMDQEDDDAES